MFLVAEDMKNGMKQIWKYLAAGIMGLLGLLLAMLSCSEKKNTEEEIPGGYILCNRFSGVSVTSSADFSGNE